MEESALTLAELQRIRVLFSRFVVFAAVFALLVVTPSLGLLSWASWVIARPMDTETKAELAELNRQADEGWKEIERMALETKRLTQEVVPSRFPKVEQTSEFVRKAQRPD